MPIHQKQQEPKKIKQCYFCLNNTEVFDYKDTDVLRTFVNAQSKITPRRRTGTCAHCQRQLTQAIKRARLMALLPFTLR